MPKYLSSKDKRVCTEFNEYLFLFLIIIVAEDKVLEYLKRV